MSEPTGLNDQEDPLKAQLKLMEARFDAFEKRLCHFQWMLVVGFTTVAAIMTLFEFVF